MSTTPPMSKATRTLWRPVGPEELALIEALEWRAFPPRLIDQPYFYPVHAKAYACEIAREWNAKDGNQGFVVEFEVDTAHAERYGTRRVGGAAREEFWVPAEELPAFNAAIVGKIRVVETFEPRT